MNVKCAWLLWLITVIAIFALGYGVANADQTIERSIDNRTILLNTHKCDGVGGTGYKLYKIENNVVKSGCFENDGKYVLETIDGIVTKYDKRLFELGVHD
jgi:hypothetical protein